MTQVRGDGVVLRGLRPEEVDVVLPRVARVELASGDRTAVERKRARLERSGERTTEEIWFVVEAGDRLVGDVQGRCPDMAMPPGVWEIGIELWEESDRGRGLGRTSCALLARHLFEAEGAIRVQATTDLNNAAMRRTLEALGFGFEGTLRGFMPQSDGEPRDYAMYGLTRRDWEQARTTWIRTS